MKSCVGCVFAKWKRTASGALHPSGDGQCTFEVKIPVIPASRYWLFGDRPGLGGGRISRRKELRDHCPTYQRKEAGWAKALKARRKAEIVTSEGTA